MHVFFYLFIFFPCPEVFENIYKILFLVVHCWYSNVKGKIFIHSEEKPVYRYSNVNENVDKANFFFKSYRSKVKFVLLL